MELFYLFCFDAKGRGSSNVAIGGGVTPFYDISRTKKKTLCLILIEMFSTVEWTEK